MIKKYGNLFDTEQSVLGHGVNCQGVMGAGIAKEFRSRFPNNYDAYKQACETGRGPGGYLLVPGQVILHTERDRLTDEIRTIVNLATQDKPGADAQYSHVFNSAMRAAYRLVNNGSRVMAVPMIGAGIGGLEWDKVETLLRAVEVLNPGFQFEVWEYNPWK
jgi:O-acetyl-ADP-ribose deacetylase (regulator of RNase III)